MSPAWRICTLCLSEHSPGSPETICTKTSAGTTCGGTILPAPQVACPVCGGDQELLYARACDKATRPCPGCSGKFQQPILNPAERPFIGDDHAQR